MATETTTEAGTQNTAAVADTSAVAATTGEAKATILAGDDAGKTAEGVEAGDKSAETGADAGADKGEGGDADKSKDDTKPDGPPEKYEFTMPEGVELDAALAEKVDPVLRELGLSNEQANKLAATFAEHRVSETQRQSEAYAKQVEGWGDAIREDAEVGGANLKQSVALAQSAIGRFGSPELKEMLYSGLGDHPDLFRFCVNVGKALREDGGVDSNNSATPKDPAAVLFDHPTSKPKR